MLCLCSLSVLSLVKPSRSSESRERAIDWWQQSEWVRPGLVTPPQIIFDRAWALMLYIYGISSHSTTDHLSLTHPTTRPICNSHIPPRTTLTYHPYIKRAPLLIGKGAWLCSNLIPVPCSQAGDLVNILWFHQSAIESLFSVEEPFTLVSYWHPVSVMALTNYLPLRSNQRVERG